MLMTPTSLPVVNKFLSIYRSIISDYDIMMSYLDTVTFLWPYDIDLQIRYTFSEYRSKTMCRTIPLISDHIKMKWYDMIFYSFAIDILSDIVAYLSPSQTLGEREMLWEYHFSPN